MSNPIVITGGMNTINVDTLMRFSGTYRKMKEKYRLQSDDNMYYNMGYNVLLSMFEHDEKIFRPELFESILHDCGVAALIKTTTADWTPVFVYIKGGERYADGYFRNCTCFDLTGKSYDFTDWRENENILVFFNNLTHTPDDFIDKYSYMLTNVDTSIDFNVFYSRLKPTPIARDAATKNQIDNVLTDLGNGKIKTVLADTNIKDIVENGQSIEVMNLTDVESSKYIQYLSHLYDSLISRLFFHMGLSIADNGKQAQISVEELNKNKSAALALIQPWFIARTEGYEIAKQKTGQDWTLKYNTVWQSEVEANEFNPEKEQEDSSIVDNNDEGGDDNAVQDE